MRIGLLVFLMLVSVNLFAAEKNFCTPLTNLSQNKEIILPGPDDPKGIKIYFFTNKTSQSIWIDHPVERPSASAGWSSYLRKENSSALLVNRKDFAISCAVIAPGKVDYLDCAKAISVCVADKVTVASSRKGTYWLAEDKSWDELLKALNKRGVQIK